MSMVENLNFPVFLYFLPKNTTTGNFVIKIVTRYSNGRFMFMLGSGKIVDTIQSATKEAKKQVQVTGLLRKTNLFKNWYMNDKDGNQVRSDRIDFQNMNPLPIEIIERHKKKFDILQFKTTQTTILKPKASRLKTSVPLVADSSNNQARKRSKLINTSIESSSRVWDASTMDELLTYTDAPPELYAAKQISNTDAECTFKHPNGSFVHVELPISYILYVPAYKSIVSTFIVNDN